MLFYIFQIIRLQKILPKIEPFITLLQCEAFNILKLLSRILQSNKQQNNLPVSSQAVASHPTYPERLRLHAFPF